MSTNLPNETVSYRVITVSELDKMVYDKLVELGAAKRSPKGHNQYEITDTAVAQSSNILPKVLNDIGKTGWLLTTINKMECYIFSRAIKRTPIEYKVMTPPQMDDIAISHLELAGHASMETADDGSRNLEIHKAEHAKIQNVLPKVLAAIGADGWTLAAVNGPQLYIFSRHA